MLIPLTTFAASLQGNFQENQLDGSNWTIHPVCCPKAK